MERKNAYSTKHFVEMYIRNNYLDPLKTLWSLWALMLISKFSWYKNMEIAKHNPRTLYILNCLSL
jgi:hypothetical protein